MSDPYEITSSLPGLLRGRWPEPHYYPAKRATHQPIFSPTAAPKAVDIEVGPKTGSRNARRTLGRPLQSPHPTPSPSPRSRPCGFVLLPAPTTPLPSRTPPLWGFHEKAHPVKGQRGGLRQLGQRSTLRATFPSALFSSLSRRLGARWDPSGAALLFEVRPLAQSADHTPS